MSSQQQEIVQIAGMTCSACETFIERKFGKTAGISSVKADAATGCATIKGEHIPSHAELNALLAGSDYTVTGTYAGSANGWGRRLTEIGGIAIIAFALLMLIERFGSLTQSFGVNETMGYGFVFLLGLIASVSSCIAVTGGLLLALSARFVSQHPESTSRERFKPHLYFNIGRIVSYTVLGGVVGALGSLLTLTPFTTGLITIAASIIMLSLGFQMLSVFPWMKKLRIKMPRKISNAVHALSESDSRFAPFTLGAATFFLPCGFTQALQFYVLSRGEPLEGALIMFVFSLGTLPALISLGALTSFVKGGVKRFVFRTAGVVVIVLGLLSLKSGLALTGIAGTFDKLVTNIVAEKPSGDRAPIQGGVQVVDMRVEGYEYFPSQFTVVAGTPVEWRVDGRNAAGCAQIITIPGMRLTKRLSKSGITTITFTPQQEGRLDFSCTMGMTTPGARFTVVSGSGNQLPQGNPEESGPIDYTKCDPSRAMCL